MNYIERVVKNSGTRIEKLDEINGYVSDRYRNAVDSRCRIHDSDLRRWALMDEWFLKVFLKDWPLEKHLLCDSLSTYKNTQNVDA